MYENTVVVVRCCCWTDRRLEGGGGSASRVGLESLLVCLGDGQIDRWRSDRSHHGPWWCLQMTLSSEVRVGSSEKVEVAAERRRMNASHSKTGYMRANERGNGGTVRRWRCRSLRTSDQFCSALTLSLPLSILLSLSILPVIQGCPPRVFSMELIHWNLQPVCVQDEGFQQSSQS